MKKKKVIRKLKKTVEVLAKRNIELEADLHTLIHEPNSFNAQMLKFKYKVKEDALKALWFSSPDSTGKGFLEQIKSSN